MGGESARRKAERGRGGGGRDEWTKMVGSAQATTSRTRKPGQLGTYQAGQGRDCNVMGRVRKTTRF